MAWKSRVGDGVKPFGKPLKNYRSEKFFRVHHTQGSFSGCEPAHVLFFFFCLKQPFKRPLKKTLVKTGFP